MLLYFSVRVFGEPRSGPVQWSAIIDAGMLLKPLLLACALALGANAAMSAPADARGIRPTWAAPENERRSDQAQIRPVREVVENVRRQFGGELISVQRLEQNANPPFYVLRWRFPNEVVDDVRVNAITGQVMGR